MKALFFIGSILFFSSKTSSQMIVEGLVGDEYLFYQHLIHKKFTAKSKAGFMHLVNMTSRYQTDIKKGGRPNEVMNQVYLTTRLNQSFTLLTGVFYNNVIGIRTSVGIQYAKAFKNGLLVMVPRADVKKYGAVELMSMLEYQPVIGKSVKLYTRLQVMSNYGAYQHNRSYQRLRLGISIKDIQLGVGMHLDEYGKESRVNMNTGVFIRKQII